MTVPGGNDRTIDFRFAPGSRWTAICRADDPHKSVVDETGALLYGFRSRSFEAWSFDEVVGFRAAAEYPPRLIEQRTETARRAVVVTVAEYERQRLTLTAFASVGPAGQRSDVVLWEIVCTDRPDQQRAALLTGLHIDVFQHGAAQLTTGPVSSHTVWALPSDAVDAVPTWIDDARVDGVDVAGRVKLQSTAPLVPTHPTGLRPGTAFVTQLGVLEAGQSLRGAVVVPLEGAAVAVDLRWAERALERTRAYWDALSLRANTLELPDGAVQDMVDAASRNILQAREVVDGIPQLQVGPTVYRGMWVVDGHFLVECARYLGLDAAAEHGMAALLRRVRKDGSIAESVEPHIKETGVALASLVRDAELTGDLEQLRRRWPVVQAACAYIDELRQEASRLPESHPMHGLLPVAFADGGLAGARAELTTVLWTLTGLRYVADAAARLEVPDRETHRERLQSLRDAFVRRLPSLLGKLEDGRTYLPMSLPASGSHHYIPDTPDKLVPRHRRIGPLTATWALCHAIWPGELFSSDDPLVANLLDLLETVDDEEGIPIETGWLPFQAVWTYYASFAAHVWLYKGRPDKAVDYLYAFANHAAPTRVWREEQSLRDSGHGQICGDMPHNWASAEFIRLVLHLLVFERGDELLLLPGLPEHWRGPVRIADHPTRFGRVSIEVAPKRGGRTRVDVAIDGPAYQTAAVVRLRLPGGGPGRARIVAGGGRRDVWLDCPSGWVELPTDGPITVVLSSSPAANA